MTREKKTEQAVKVVAPARLHLGFLDLDGGLGRRFGSIGLAIDAPATTIVLGPAPSFTATGPEADRALALLTRFAGELGLPGAFAADVREAIPAHAGLGSGTQLALGLGAGLMRLAGGQGDVRRLGEMADRGARSGIGMAAFDTGGFVIDGGRASSGEREDRAPPVISRLPFPDAWRALLILDRRAEGVHGIEETQAFAALPPFTAARAAHLCRIAMMRLLPGLAEADLDVFGDALTEIQEILGEHFAPAQGGSAWTSPGVGEIAGRLRDLGARGIGQSSWGPTGFAFAGSEAAAARLYTTLTEEAKARGLELRIVRGRNTGARVEFL